MTEQNAPFDALPSDATSAIISPPALTALDVAYAIQRGFAFPTGDSSENSNRAPQNQEETPETQRIREEKDQKRKMRRTQVIISGIATIVLSILLLALEILRRYA